MRPLCSLIVLLLLAGCASGQDGFGRRSASPGVRAVAWDGLGPDPERPLHKARKDIDTAASALAGREQQRQRKLATLQPYSAAWWAVYDEIEADRDASLTKRLAICAGCGAELPPDETTASVR